MRLSFRFTFPSIPMLALMLASVALSVQGPSLLHAQRLLTLEEARSAATRNAEELAIARLGVTQAERGVAAARAQRLPRLDLNASYTHVSETASIDFSIPGVLSRSFSFGDGNVYDASLTASVPLFTGFRLQGMLHLQETQRGIAQRQLQGSEVTMHNRVTAAYLRAQFVLRTRVIYDGQLTYLGVQLAVLKQLYAQGQIIPYDTLLLSTRVSALRVERAEAESAYRNALIGIADLTGLPADFQVDDKLAPQPALSAADADALLDLAMAQRTDLAALRESISAGEHRVRLEKASLLPSLSAFASARYGRPGVDQIANEWMPYYTAGMALQWNLWSWGGDHARIEQQEIALQEQQLRRDRLKRQIGSSIRSLLNDLRVIDQTRGMLDEQLAQEHAKRDLLEARLRQGLSTATELVDAETALTTALLRREQSDIQYRLKLTELANAIGMAI
ncbi:MAG: TolC family protein [Bacteroidetes bacterium]|nr:TolC family protein [Bacteroidota bacterium]